MPMHLRGESCALRLAFRKWFLFTAFLAVYPLLSLGETIGVVSLGWGFFIPDFIDVVDVILGRVLTAPEMVVMDLVDQYGWVPWPDRFFMLMLALFVARSFVVFAWGVFRLQRGKHAPYAETLWLLSVSRLVVEWRRGGYVSGYDFMFLNQSALMLVMAGIVVFALRRRRPPAWKRKTPA